MFKDKIVNALNKQIEKEFYSSNLYLSMAIWAESNGFEGVANWFFAQAEEERIHMLKFVKYVDGRGGKAIIPSVEQPPADFKNIHTIFKKVLEHEIYISNSINDLVGICFEEKDFSTQSWLQWFVNEQIEEEASIKLILDKLSLIGEDKNNLYMFDKDIMSLRNTTASQQ